jgi:hypothetical protein
VTSEFFLSHAGTDREFAFRLYNDLYERGYKVWIDKKQILGGNSLVGDIEDSIKNVRYFLLILSPAAIASRWVMKEYHSAMNLHLSGGNIRIIPLLLVSCDIPLFTYETHYIDFRDKDRYDSSFKELLETLTVRPSDKQAPVIQYQHHAQRVITLSRKRSLFIGRSALVHQIVETL